MGRQVDAADRAVIRLPDADHRAGDPDCPRYAPHQHVGEGTIRWLSDTSGAAMEAIIEAAIDVAMQRGGDAALRANGLAVTSRRAMDRLVGALTEAGRTTPRKSVTLRDADPAEAEGMEDWIGEAEGDAR